VCIRKSNNQFYILKTSRSYVNQAQHRVFDANALNPNGPEFPIRLSAPRLGR
jgi:hypothetical protein